MPSSRLFLGLVPWYSLLILTGICLAIFWCTREEKRLGLPQDTTVDLALWVVPMGILGARLYYVAFSWPQYAAAPLSILRIWEGGLAIYGGILGGLAAVAIFARRKRISMAMLCDMVIPGVVLAQALGRWGNYFNMEAYGLPIIDPSLQFFPLAVLIPELGGDVWHMATFFYESLWDLGTFVTLALLRRHVPRRGDVLCWYMVLYGAGRLVIEGLRMDSLTAADGTFRVSQLLSVCLCMGAAVWFALRALPRVDWKRAWPAVMVSLTVTVLAMCLLPAPAEAFCGYRITWLLLMVLCAVLVAALAFGTPCAAKRKAAALIPAAAMLASLSVTLWAASAPAGPAASVALCAAFGAVCIAMAGWCCPAVNNKER